MLVTDTLRAHHFAWLATDAGERLLAEAAALPDDRLARLTRLRARFPAELATIAVELLELRRRARARFAEAERMFFTPEGLEQSTGDGIAAYRAARFAGHRGVLDACSGIGGDARHLALAAPVLAVDLSPAAAVCTQLNTCCSARQELVAQIDQDCETRSLPSPSDAYPVRTVCGDVTRLPLSRLRDRGIDAVFFDPSRRAGDRHGVRRRVRSEDYTPALLWIETLVSYFGSIGVKVSPAIEDSALQCPGWRVEFLSDRGECKEAVLWRGGPAEYLGLPGAEKAGYFATVLRPGQPPETLAPFDSPPLASGPPSDYLYEPDPSVIRAHLIPQIACRLSARAIEPGIAYLTSDRRVATPFAAAYRILDTFRYDRKLVQRRLAALGAHVAAVKKRGVDIEPSAVQKSLRPSGPVPVVLVLMRAAGRVLAMLCERL